MNYVTPPFAWKSYKGCKIIATGRYNGNQCWTSKATVYWKRSNEKHLAFLNGPDNFDNRKAAEDHAMSLATQWCDEHILGELVEAPRISPRST